MQTDDLIKWHQFKADHLRGTGDPTLADRYQASVDKLRRLKQLEEINPFDGLSVQERFDAFEWLKNHPLPDDESERHAINILVGISDQVRVVRETLHFLKQVDPVHWSDRQKAHQVIAALQRLIED